MSQQRFAPIPHERMSPQQRAVADKLVNGPRAGIRGPFPALLRNPGLAERVRELGHGIRFENSLPPPLREMVILIVARFWAADYEWYAHRRIALEAGLDAMLIDAIEKEERPSGMSDDEALVHDFCSELLKDKDVSDATYDSAMQRFGETGTLDVICTAGYFSMVALILNASRHPIPEGAAALKRAR